MTFEILNRETVFKGKVFDIDLYQVRLPDGRTGRLDIVQHNDAVTLVPFDADGQIWFIRQYRLAARKELLELPAGVMENGETPLEAAQRELREETGLAAGRLQKIASFYLAAGYTTECMHVFLAEELFPSPLPPDVNEQLTLEKMSLEQALRLVESGQIEDAKTLVALLRVEKLIQLAT